MSTLIEMKNPKTGQIEKAIRQPGYYGPGQASITFISDRMTQYNENDLLAGKTGSESGMDGLIKKVTDWSRDRKILEHGNLRTQCLKLMSEVGELADNIAKGRDTKDDIGDCLVILNNLAIMSGSNLKSCLEVAYEDIKERRGIMNPNGVFIKEADY
jgi:NTP pyrophosphatase (non-canonical NTP hydrolase)